MIHLSPFRELPYRSVVVYNRKLEFMQATHAGNRGNGTWNRSRLERSPETADQVWRNTVLQIPTVFGRLVFLASLYDPSSGKYRSGTLDSLLEPQAADRAIRHSHYQVFSQWLSFNLAEQKEDISEFLNGSGARGRAAAQAALLYRQLIPASAREVERQLYCADLETLLEVLKAEYTGVFSSPKA